MAVLFQSSEVLARLKPFGITFEKSLTDLIKGIRAHSKDSPEALSTFLANAIQECKEELVTTDLEVKATAVLKLAYLEMYGFDMSWCNFHILEVMSSLKFQQKRIGYLAATQSFKSEQDLLILATNQFKKDLNSHNHIEIGLALSGIATIVTPNLAKDIVEDIVMKLTHSKPYIRKKAVLALFKIFLQYPESWKAALPRVIEKLDDPDVAVVSATITVVCEISKKHPSFFLAYLPKFFTILEDTSNNWLIIRILKLFQSLLKIEPRMKKRIMPSIVSLMSKTDATSLIYESINCIVDGSMISPESSRDKEVAKMCIDHLLKFFHQNDSNLRFVGLLALIKILHVFPSFIHKLSEVSSVIYLCIQDDDIIIKRKALEICHYLVTEDNITNLVKTLLLQILPENTSAHCPETFKLEITSKILEITSANNYGNIPNFKWYVVALKELLNMTLLAESSRLVDDGKVILSRDVLLMIASKLGNEFKSLAMKVPSIRPYIISKVVMEYVKNVRLLQTCPILMKDLYWVMGEYLDDYGLIETESGDDLDSTTSLSQKVTLFNLFVNKHIDEKLLGDAMFPISSELPVLPNADVISSIIEALVKLFSSIVTDYEKLYSSKKELSYDKYCELSYFLLKLIRFFEHWESNTCYEVQERCSSWLEYLKLCFDSLKVDDVEGVKRLETEELQYYEKLLLDASQDDALSRNSDELQSSDESEASDDSSDEDKEGVEPSESSHIAGSHQTDFEDESNGGDTADRTQSLQGNEFESSQLPALLTKILPSFFKSYPLNPISALAQSRIQVPADLDLEAVIQIPPAYCFQEDNKVAAFDLSDESGNESSEEVADRELLARDRLDRMKDDPYYLKSSDKKKPRNKKSRIVSLEDDRLVSGSGAPSEVPSLIDLSEAPSGKSKKSKKVKKEKVLVLAEDSLGDDKEGAMLGPEKKEKKLKKNKLIIDTLNLDALNLDSPDVELDLSSKPYEYEVDLNQLRSQFADESMKKAGKEKKRSKKREKTKAIEAVEPIVDKNSEAGSDHLVSIPQKSKKKKKRAVIQE
ncbi:Adaptor protein complex AP-3 delta subunit [Metschnikowia bicuspidata var. bicuspidata NRRL YB-4993]|uniref:AP-3 complex subunit delta n=1 Tax=Metschnikowia bicuspidata var. bicuspidata NRRL YB-4993 TaxID=869754 RepID=A0A1A0HJW2_9ASCO|nr:Adaptor protein complex AP-3 delta subunit [Metschnikowia bicuspidata var. bicuspidata NRRL YB-4993]OBA24310.1 Adaptor protein complex AP-3 delta subunit [Metschnikowia bicuspidata var. bicuspidata NRRL YB-4993]